MRFFFFPFKIKSLLSTYVNLTIIVFPQHIMSIVSAIQAYINNSNTVLNNLSYAHELVCVHIFQLVLK